MKLFRRGNVYLCYHSPESAFTFDAETGLCSTNYPARAIVGDKGQEWLPVLPDESTPAELDRLLLLKFPPKD